MGFAGFFGSIPKEPMAKDSFQLAHIFTRMFTDKLPHASFHIRRCSLVGSALYIWANT